MNIRDNYENMTLNDLVNAIDDPMMAEYMKENYLRVLENIESNDLADACNALAYCMSHNIDGLELSEETYEINQHIADICRIGINELSNDRTPEDFLKNHVEKGPTRLELFVRLAVSMFNIHRPIAAFHFLDCAENCCNILLPGPDMTARFRESMNVYYERCRAMEAEFYLRLIDDLPKEYRKQYAAAAYSYIKHAINNLQRLGDQRGADAFACYIRDAEYYWNLYPMSDQEIEQMNNTSMDKGYQKWCQETVRFLNLLNEIPDICICDDITLNLDERHQWLLEDIIHTYDHCRKLLFNAVPNPFKIINADRNDDVEGLVDCFVRLYTLLDKSAKLIVYLFPRDESIERPNFYDVAESLANSPNPYLRSIYSICRDIFPDRIADSDRTFDPRNNCQGIVMKRGFVRNSIIHDTLKVFKTHEDKGIYQNVASVTPMELHQFTNMMMYDVREIVLNIQLAVEYRKTH